ncbi:MAG: hypothetical protein UT19_C0004G0082 [Candidatus Woesebacteria bacterium GW2011_GWB1_39_10b]|uniref:ROK family protein n=3 Tax=Candidatus Woeseibacteriota TaxID=1752722 RepID=A0A0G0NBP1_9BACT|nr:MAG: hypothetical protein US72_C0018G0007 [Microgenomates group bacterium GW2011_GWC1_38_12]KKQ94121.1 MAG: hypothetical protein UT19_C0004G0082 [Candidatus Woesebacteria bacterium GW2011_GWB1_39_10b]KKR13579.1 MAG: hypothetical protein UT40_C0014G0035 [Candidatus Woesebacteria bacterium GW2011_GWA1_39_21b]
MCAKYITQCNESDANILGHANVANDFFSHRVNMYLLFDIGGTKMRMAVSFDGQNMQEVKVVATPRKFEDVLKVIESYIGIADSTRSDKLVCCGLPGTLDKEKSMLISAPNLEEWKMKPIKKALSDMIRAPIYLENDAGLAGLGEALKGAGRGFSIVAFITIGTGVGGVRIVDGRIDRSTFGFEPGHQIIDLEEERYFKLESFVSGTSIKLKFGQDAERIKDENVWKKIEKLIAVGLNNTILHWSPEVVILGGGIMKIENISIEAIKQNLKEILKVFPTHPEIKRGELLEIAGLAGALNYLKQLK